MAAINPRAEVQSLILHHVPEVAALERQCFSAPWSEDQFYQAFEQDSFRLWGLISEPENLVVAYLAVYCVAGELEILNIAVSPQYRRAGLGRLLLATVLQNVAKEGISRALLEVRRSNIPAIGLYECLGFEALGVRPRYYQDTNEDAIIYGLEISPA